MKLTQEQQEILSNQAFSREKSNLRALLMEIRRNKTMAKSGIHKDFNRDHPDWVKQANLVPPSFADLEIKTAQIVIKKQEIQMDRFRRLHATK